jgi:hypothetical protein
MPKKRKDVVYTHRLDTDGRESVRAINKLIDLVPGAADAVSKIADVEGRGPDGELVPTGDLSRELASVSVSPPTLAGQVGDVFQLTATLRDREGVPMALPAGVTMSWASRAPQFATVDSSGVVTLVAPGDVHIDVKAGIYWSTVPVTVRAAPAANRVPAYIVVSPPVLKLRVAGSEPDPDPDPDPDPVPTPDTTPPTVPTQLAANVTSTSVALTWTASTDVVGVTGYQVRRAGVLVATVPTPGYVDSGRTAGTSYFYAVRAVDAAGNVSPDATITATTATPAPAPSTHIVQAIDLYGVAGARPAIGYDVAVPNELTMAQALSAKIVDQRSGTELAAYITDSGDRHGGIDTPTSVRSIHLALRNFTLAVGERANIEIRFGEAFTVARLTTNPRADSDAWIDAPALTATGAAWTLPAGTFYRYRGSQPERHALVNSAPWDNVDLTHATGRNIITCLYRTSAGVMRARVLGYSLVSSEGTLRDVNLGNYPFDPTLGVPICFGIIRNVSGANFVVGTTNLNGVTGVTWQARYAGVQGAPRTLIVPVGFDRINDSLLLEFKTRTVAQARSLDAKYSTWAYGYAEDEFDKLHERIYERWGTQFPRPAHYSYNTLHLYRWLRTGSVGSLVIALATGQLHIDEGETLFDSDGNPFAFGEPAANPESDLYHWLLTGKVRAKEALQYETDRWEKFSLVSYGFPSWLETASTDKDQSGRTHVRAEEGITSEFRIGINRAGLNLDPSKFFYLDPSVATATTTKAREIRLRRSAEENMTVPASRVDAGRWALSSYSTFGQSGSGTVRNGATAFMYGFYTRQAARGQRMVQRRAETHEWLFRSHDFLHSSLNTATIQPMLYTANTVPPRYEYYYAMHQALGHPALTNDYGAELNGAVMAGMVEFLEHEPTTSPRYALVLDRLKQLIGGMRNSTDLAGKLQAKPGSESFLGYLTTLPLLHAA